MRWWERIQRLLDRVESRAALWGLIGGSSVVGVVTAYLSQGVDWINQFGAFGWWSAGLLGFLVFAWGAAAIAWMRYKWVTASATRYWEKAVDSFNPLARELHTIRFRLSDLANPIHQRIQGKRIIDCEILGPANVVFFGNCEISGLSFINCDFVPVKERVQIFNVIVLENVTIFGGSMFNTTIYMPPPMIQIFERLGQPDYISLTGNPEIDSRSRSGPRAGRQPKIHSG